MSEFREDIVSGDWIIAAPERAKRPHDLIPKKKPRVPSPKSACPFEHPEKTGNWPPYISYPDDQNWKVILIANKYPALHHEQACAPLLKRGPYATMDGVGNHDLIVTRNHNNNFADISPGEAAKVFEILQERYRMLTDDSCRLYTSTFFNWGLSAGASLFHPHYQVVTLPIIPPGIAASLLGSARYFKKHRRCVHCVILAYEKREKSRVIEENKYGIAIAPYISRQPFEVRVFPRRHFPYFEKTPRADLEGVARILQSSLRRIRSKLNDPDLNFFIHTSPLKNQKAYRHYHWHIEILPKVSIPAGFELGTGVIINVVSPDKAAALLR